MSVEDKVKKIIADHLCVDIDSVTDEANLSDDLGADSLDYMELVMEFEEEFDTFIEEDALDSVDTVADFIKVVKESEGMDGE